MLLPAAPSCTEYACEPSVGRLGEAMAQSSSSSSGTFGLHSILILCTFVLHCSTSSSSSVALHILMLTAVVLHHWPVGMSRRALAHIDTHAQNAIHAHKLAVWLQALTNAAARHIPM